MPIFEEKIQKQQNILFVSLPLKRSLEAGKNEDFFSRETAQLMSAQKEKMCFNTFAADGA